MPAEAAFLAQPAAVVVRHSRLCVMCGYVWLIVVYVGLVDMRLT